MEEVSERSMGGIVRPSLRKYLYCRDTVRVGETTDFFKDKYPRLILSEDKINDIDIKQIGLLLPDENIIDSFMGISEYGIKFIFFTSLRIIFFQDDEDDYLSIPYKNVEAFKTNKRENQLFLYFSKKIEEILMDGAHESGHGIHIHFAEGVNYDTAYQFMAEKVLR